MHTKHSGLQNGMRKSHFVIGFCPKKTPYSRLKTLKTITCSAALLRPNKGLLLCAPPPPKPGTNWKQKSPLIMTEKVFCGEFDCDFTENVTSPWVCVRLSSPRPTPGLNIDRCKIIQEKVIIIFLSILILK